MVKKQNGGNVLFLSKYFCVFISGMHDLIQTSADKSLIQVQTLRGCITHSLFWVLLAVGSAAEDPLKVLV